MTERLGVRVCVCVYRVYVCTTTLCWRGRELIATSYNYARAHAMR